MAFDERRPQLHRIGAEMIRCAQEQGQDVTPIDEQIQALIQSGASPEEINAGILSIVEHGSRACLRHLWRRQARQSVTRSRRLPKTVSRNPLPEGRGDSKAKRSEETKRISHAR